MLCLHSTLPPSCHGSVQLPAEPMTSPQLTRHSEELLSIYTTECCTRTGYFLHGGILLLQCCCLSNWTEATTHLDARSRALLFEQHPSLSLMRLHAVGSLKSCLLSCCSTNRRQDGKMQTLHRPLNRHCDQPSSVSWGFDLNHSSSSGLKPKS